MARPLIGLSLAALLAGAACTGSPSAPGTAGATIGGLVNGGFAAASSPSTVSPQAATGSGAGLTVTVEGTGLSSAVDASGQFRLTDVPAGDARLRFSGEQVNATVLIANVGSAEEIQIQVAVAGSTATLVSESRSGPKVELCHATGTGEFHLIDVSTSAEPAHRAHGDGKVGDRVPGTLTKVFDRTCQPRGVGVNIEKLTNGEDADVAPGPSIKVGDPVTWTYVVTNTSAGALSGISVTDSKGVVVTCVSQSILAIGASMTCTGSGVAALGPYSNVGTVTAMSAAGPRTDSDPSHYLGVRPEEADERKVRLCHRTGAGFYNLIEVGASAEPAHRAHGDGAPGERAPGNGGIFSPSCTIG